MRTLTILLGILMLLLAAPFATSVGAETVQTTVQDFRRPWEVRSFVNATVSGQDAANLRQNLDESLPSGGDHDGMAEQQEVERFQRSFEEMNERYKDKQPPRDGG